MRKLRALTISLLGVACLFLIACQTPGTPKQSGGTPKKTVAAAGPQAQRTAESAGQGKTARKAGDKRPAARAPRVERKGKLLDRPVKAARAILGKPITTLRGILYATLALITIVVIGAIAAERVGRHRKLSPSTSGSSSAR